MIATHPALPMYAFPELSHAHERLWRAIESAAREAGVEGDVPLSQVCGYPLINGSRDRYDVIAAPRYALPFCEAATHRAVIVVGVESARASVDDLRGATFAINALDSNTGMNLPRRLFAALANGRAFFGGVTITGSHAASLARVAEGSSDAASIDVVTFALLAEQRPQAVAGVRILAVSEASPTPPFVTPRATPPRIKARLYEALSEAFSDGALAPARRALRLGGVERATLARYRVLARYEREARTLGYPELV